MQLNKLSLQISTLAESIPAVICIKNYSSLCKSFYGKFHEVVSFKQFEKKTKILKETTRENTTK